jgi:hypothetical protein
VRTHPTLAPFTAGDYRASVFWFRHLDLAALVVMSCILVLWTRPAGVASIAFKAAASAACPLAVLALLWRVRPYPPDAAWKLRVRSYALLLAVLASAANAAVALDPGGLSAAGLGYSLVPASGGLLLALVAAFGYSAVTGARREQLVRLRDAAEEAAAAATATGSQARQRRLAIVPRRVRKFGSIPGSAAADGAEAAIRRGSGRGSGSGDAVGGTMGTRNPLWLDRGPGAVVAAAATSRIRTAQGRASRSSVAGRHAFAPAAPSSASARPLPVAQRRLLVAGSGATRARQHEGGARGAHATTITVPLHSAMEAEAPLPGWSGSERAQLSSGLSGQASRG